MNDSLNKALLPAGLSDILAPDAHMEAKAVEKIMNLFSCFGYERVKPPLIEFEECLLSGNGGAGDISFQTFRIMDPVSQRMMGVRADMTIQVARIAATRLGKSPRPLRLSYAGQVLRVKGSQLKPARQFTQAGFELIGTDSASADAEAIMLAAEALQDLGIDDISIDINLPSVVPSLCDFLGLDEKQIKKVREALNHKDLSIDKLIEGGEVFKKLLEASGTASRAVSMLTEMNLPEKAARECKRLADVVSIIENSKPELILTVDAVENRGFEYHSGISFSIFAKGARGELGRGGRYVSGTETEEPSTGVTLFLDSIMRVLPFKDSRRKIYIPFGTERKTVKDFIEKGWTVINGLEKEHDVEKQALIHKCSAIYLNNQVVEILQEKITP